MPNAYVVTINVPGYVPNDTDPPVFTTRRDAESYAAEEARRILEFETDDQGETTLRKRGSARAGGIVITDVSDSNRLGWVIEIHKLTGEEAADALAYIGD